MKMPRDRDREVKFQKKSREFSRNETLAGYWHVLHLYSSEHCVGIVQLKLKETAFYPLIVTDLANLFHCPSDVSWGPTRRASDGRAGTQGGTCKYNMSVQFLIHHPFKQDYKTIYRESIKHFLVGRF